MRSTRNRGLHLLSVFVSRIQDGIYLYIKFYKLAKKILVPNPTSFHSTTGQAHWVLSPDKSFLIIYPYNMDNSIHPSNGQFP